MIEKRTRAECTIFVVLKFINNYFLKRILKGVWMRSSLTTVVLILLIRKTTSQHPYSCFEIVLSHEERLYILSIYCDLCVVPECINVKIIISLLQVIYNPPFQLPPQSPSTPGVFVRPCIAWETPWSVDGASALSLQFPLIHTKSSSVLMSRSIIHVLHSHSHRCSAQLQV